MKLGAIPEVEPLLVPVLGVSSGDQLLVGGEWLTVDTVQGSPDGGVYLTMTDERVFQARANAERVARKAP